MAKDPSTPPKKTPAAKTPAVQTPAAKLPAVQAPAAGKPTTKKPTTRKPATKAAAAAVTATLPSLHPDHIAALLEGRHPQPHATLGQHPLDDGFIIRVIRSLAESVTAIHTDGSRVPLTHLADGLWQGFAVGHGQAYKVETTYSNGPDWVTDDPYRFVPSVGELDLYLWGQGRHEQLWQVFGAHFRPH